MLGLRVKEFIANEIVPAPKSKPLAIKLPGVSTLFAFVKGSPPNFAIPEPPDAVPNTRYALTVTCLPIFV